MKATKSVSFFVAAGVAAPYLADAFKSPGALSVDGPDAVLMAIQVGVSTGSTFGVLHFTALDTIRGHEISVMPRTDLNPRPAFIAPPVAVKSS